MNKKKSMEERVRRLVQGVWVLQSRKLPDGTVLKPPEISGVFIYTPRHFVAHWVLNDSYASVFEEYKISGSKVFLKRLSTISGKIPLGTEGPEVNTTPRKREMAVQIEGDELKGRIEGKALRTRMVIKGDTWTETEPGLFEHVYKKVPSQ